MNWNELFNYKDGFIFRKSNELIAVGNRTSSGYLRTNVMGKEFRVRSGKWAARVYQNRKEIHLGVFKCKFEAARAAEKKRIELFGQFAGCDLHPLPGGG